MDHRGIKSRTNVIKGFKHIFNAAVFCTAFDEIRQFVRMKNKTRSKRRELLTPRIHEFNQPHQIPHKSSHKT